MISVKHSNILLHFFITAQITFYHDYRFVRYCTNKKNNSCSTELSLLCENCMLHFYQVKESTIKKAQYIKQLEIPAYQVPKHNEIAVLYRNHSRVEKV